MLGLVNENGFLTRSWTLKAARTSWSDPPVSQHSPVQSKHGAVASRAKSRGRLALPVTREISAVKLCRWEPHQALPQFAWIEWEQPAVSPSVSPPNPLPNSRTLCGLAPLRARAVLSLRARKDLICTRDESLPRWLQIPQALFFTPRECRSGIQTKFNSDRTCR